jgi:hypothetical protein
MRAVSEQASEVREGVAGDRAPTWRGKCLKDGMSTFVDAKQRAGTVVLRSIRNETGLATIL